MQDLPTPEEMAARIYDLMVHVDAHLKLTRAARLKLTHPLGCFEGISSRRL